MQLKRRDSRLRYKWWNRELNLRVKPTGRKPYLRESETTPGKGKNSSPEVVGSIPTVFITIFFFTSCGSLIPFTRAYAQWAFHGFHLAL